MSRSIASVAGALSLAVCVLVVVGCGGSRPAAPPGSQPEAADRLFAQLAREHALARDRQALGYGRRLLAAAPDYARRDEAVALMVGSARRLGDGTTAVSLARDLAAVAPASPQLPGVFADAAAAARAAGMPAAAVEMDMRRHALEGGTALADSVTRDIARLNAAAAEQLYQHTRGLDLWSLAAQRVVVVRLEGGDRAGAEAVVGDLMQTGVTGPALQAVQQQLTGAVGGRVAVKVGVICPLTDRYASLGNAFYEGARLALAAVDPDSQQAITLRVEDTGGDPVLGALAARKLCDDPACVAVVGGLLSATTASAAVVTGYCGLPQVSPTATNNRLGRLGPHILQTNLTGPLEARLLASLAVRVLMKQRFAVLYPQSPEGEALADAFQTAVAELGGALVVSRTIDPAATDFHSALREIRAAHPEVLYVPATVDQMLLLGPQIDFYHVGALLMGPSTWMAPKLLRGAGTVMEDALCAADEIIYPETWSADFRARWNPANYPEDATPLAQRAYLATRLVLDTIDTTGLRRRDLLLAALRDRMPGAEVAAEDSGSLAATVRLARNGHWVPFPEFLFDATSDSLAMAPFAAPDTLVVEPEPPEESDTEILH